MATKWNLVIRIFKDSNWVPLRDVDYPTKRDALDELNAHIRWANRQGLDRRDFAAVNFAKEEFLPR